MQDGRTIGRRGFLGTIAAVPVLGATRATRAAEDEPQGLVMRESMPRNLESPFSELDGFITPTESFFVRSHFAVPELKASDWTLKIEGKVGRPFEIGYDELRKLPSRTIPAMIECAGNGRVLLVPKANGLLWENGAVGNAEWTGVPLSALLERAGLDESAVELVLEGRDKGTIGSDPKPPGEIHFARSVTVAKGVEDVLLAYQMNGEDLTPAHGFPVRAVVPGWYGMASVKWLSRVVAIDRPYGGFFQTFDYSTFERTEAGPSLAPLRENGVKSQIARPARDEVVPRGKPYRVHGAAWAGEGNVAKVELSADGGKTWGEAKLLGENVPFAWRRWEWTWEAPGTPGTARLISRATDDRGRTQPDSRDPHLRTVKIHHLVPIEVRVD